MLDCAWGSPLKFFDILPCWIFHFSILFWFLNVNSGLINAIYYFGEPVLRQDEEQATHRKLHLIDSTY